MGTRADFYIGRGESAEWLGSIAWDGHPGSIDAPVVEAKTEPEFRAAVEAFAATRDDWTKPSDGWPWPWNTSATTDYAYALDDGKVFASSFGHAWFDATADEPEDDGAQTAVFPDMSARKNVTLGNRSGVIVITAR